MRLNGQAVLSGNRIVFKRREAALLGTLGVAGDPSPDPPESRPEDGRESGTVCWGLWLDTCHRDYFHAKSGETDGSRNRRLSPDERQFPHLIVSPLHPSRWTSAFRLEAFLDRAVVDDPSSPGGGRDPLRAAYRLLEELNTRLGVKTLLSEGGIGGYDLFTFQALCEFPEVRERMSRDDAEFLGEAAALLGQRASEALERRRVNRLRQIGLEMLPRMLHLAWALWHEDQSARATGQRTPFLNESVCDKASKPWFLEREHVERVLAELDSNEWASAAAIFEEMYRTMQAANRSQVREAPAQARDAIASSQSRFVGRSLMRSLHEHGVSGVSVRALLRLAYARVWSFPDRPEPLKFEYIKNQGLRLEGAGNPIHEFLNTFVAPGEPWRFEPGAEHRVITVFDLREGFVRLRFVRGQFAARRMGMIRVRFTSCGPDAVGARGVLRATLDYLTRDPHRYRVERIVTRPRENEPHRESGDIRILVKAGRSQVGQINWSAVTDGLAHHISRDPLAATVEVEVQAGPWTAPPRAGTT